MSPLPTERCYSVIPSPFLRHQLYPPSLFIISIQTHFFSHLKKEKWGPLTFSVNIHFSAASLWGKLSSVLPLQWSILSPQKLPMLLLSDDIFSVLFLLDPSAAFDTGQKFLPPWNIFFIWLPVHGTFQVSLLPYCPLFLIFLCWFLLIFLTYKCWKVPGFSPWTSTRLYDSFVESI